MILVKHIKLRNYPYKKTRQLAEKLAKREFQKRDYWIWRGSFFGSEGDYNYPQVIAHYTRLEHLFINKVGFAKYFSYKLYCREHRGEPDYIVYDRVNKQLKFIEVKFRHEGIKKHQLKCMREIVKKLNIPVEIWRFTDQTSRVREEIIDTPNYFPARLTKHKKVMKREKKLTVFIK